MHECQKTKKPTNHCPVCNKKIKRNSKACVSHADRTKNLKEKIERLVANNKKNSLQKHYNWKGNQIEYSGLHKWLRKKHGKPTHCEECEIGNGRLEWANTTGVYDRDIKNYAMLCKSCHTKFDRYGYELKLNYRIR